MKSLDTNILVYASNSSCREHLSCKELIDSLLSEPYEWIISTQVYWEFYKALRNPKIFSKPLSAPNAASRVEFLRKESGALVCSFEISMFDKVIKKIKNKDFPFQRMHDAVLAETLVANGVKIFYTRNEKDFKGHGFEKIVDPCM